MTRETVHVSIVIPTYNEERFIARCLDSLLANKYPANNLEILVIDGRSEDNTPAILEEYSRRHEQIKVIENEYRVQVKGLNKGLSLAKGEYILRCDAHCEYPENYISELVSFLKKGKADNVGGSIETLPSDGSISARAIARAMNHPFGVGLSFRTRKKTLEPIEADTVPFGAWIRNIFDKLGYFDENFVRAQDLEFNIRLRKSGGKIVLLPYLVTKYFTRNTLKKLMKLSYQMGYAKTQIARKYRTISSCRQLFPPIFVLGIPLAVVLKPIAFFYCLYLVLAILFGLVGAIHERNPLGLPIIVMSFLIMHVSYGIGFIKGFFDNFIIDGGRTNWDVTR